MMAKVIIPPQKNKQYSLFFIIFYYNRKKFPLSAFHFLKRQDAPGIANSETENEFSICLCSRLSLSLWKITEKGMKESAILKNIFSRLGFQELNAMQKAMAEKAGVQNIMLLSPTGSGKTVAFAIPLLKNLKPSAGNVQAVIISPSRELTIQTGKVLQSIASDFKVTSCYGGHNFEDEKNSLAVTPDVIVSTPGRLLDHIKRRNIDVYGTRILVLDEFDKSLELGFHDEMQQILRRMPNISRRILTSATTLAEIPPFAGMDNYEKIDFLDSGTVEERIDIRKVESPEKDKLETLSLLIDNLDGGKAIVFVNHREAVERIYSFLQNRQLPVGIYHGGLEQVDREKAIALLNNGTFKILVATDLGARGLDIKDIRHIVHYHLPHSEETYKHRNGRTARIDATGSIYVITAPEERLPEFVRFDSVFPLDKNASAQMVKDTETLFFSAGKKEKISKGDILGFLVAKGGLEASQIGNIEVADHYAIAAVPATRASEVVHRIAKEKIKNKRVRISVVRQQTLIF